MNAVSEVFDSSASDYLEQMQDFSDGITQQVNAACSINDQAAQDRDSAVSAVEQLHVKLSNLDLANSSVLDEVRQLQGASMKHQICLVLSFEA